jgi:predicted Ser/Thr protein kinase
MDEKQICPGCQKPLPPGVPLGLCPECLIQAGFKTGSGSGGESTGFIPPSVEQVAKLFPQLEILGFIGKGGMGAVYKARQPALERLVALKILPPTVAGAAGFAERFNREARALARLVHPNIVAVHDFGQAGGLHYLIMEFVDGANLREVERAGRLAPAQALAIVPQICEALQFAHNEGIVHRDIKPENILLDKKGRVKITDFGIAKMIGQTEGKASLTGAKDVVGTPHYMAPEQIEHAALVDHRADIFSLGVVFYEMLTGELPLGKFQPPSQIVQVDVRLDEVVLHALEKEPGRRYQQASKVKTDVETIAGTADPGGHRSEEGHSAPSAASGDSAAALMQKQIRTAGFLLNVPSIGLAIVGGINLLLYFFGALGLLLWASSHAEDVRSACLAVIVLLVLLCLSYLVIVGAVQMRRLRGYGLALSVGIVSMILPSPFLPLGVCFGLLAVFRLNRPEVRAAFRANQAQGGTIAATDGVGVAPNSATNQSAINQAEWRDPRNWSFGLYFSKRDSRVFFVPRRIPGLGWTVNLGHRQGAALLLGAFCLIIGVLALATLKRPLEKAVAPPNQATNTQAAAAGRLAKERNPEVLRIRLRQAEAEAERQKTLYNTGVSTFQDFLVAQEKADVLKAELDGDEVKVAQVRLEAARSVWQLVSQQAKAGIITLSEAAAAQAEVDVREAELKVAQAAKAAAAGATNSAR